MNAIRHTCLSLLLIVLAGCAAHKRTVLLPPYQAELQSVSLVAQFGARMNIDGQSVPMQGEVQMNESGGSLALILPHGRTLGICTYSADTGLSSEQNGPAGTQFAKMECAPAKGMGREAASLLFRAGVATYRILPALGRNSALLQLKGKGWKAHFCPTADSLNGVYTEQDGMTMSMYFVEISHL